MLQCAAKEVFNFTIKMRTFITFISVLIFASCQTSEKPNYSKTFIAQKADELQEHPGKKLMEKNCSVCHHPTASHENRLAPSIIAVKKHYKSSKTTKEEFQEAIQNWIKNPTKENSKMSGAIRRFGIMPKTPFPKKTIDLITDYMFDHKIEQPKWFEKHTKSKHKNE